MGHDLEVGPLRPEDAKAGAVEHVPGSLAQVRSFVVGLHSWRKNAVALPERFLLRLSFESLDFVECGEGGAPLVQFPYQNILCWGSSNKIFQFSIFDVENCVVGKSPDTIPIYVRTAEGKAIETWIMENVRKLMADMEQPHAVTKDEFRSLKNLLFQVGPAPSLEDGGPSYATVTEPRGPAEEGDSPSPSPSRVDGAGAVGELREDWLLVIDQFSSNRKFLTKQGMELLLLIG